MDRLQRDAERRLAELRPPSRGDERWRFADLKRARLEGLEQAQPLELAVHGLPPGVTVLSLADAMERDGALVERMLGNLRGPLGSEYFMAHAFRSDRLSTLCLWVEPGATPEAPVILEHKFPSAGGTGSALTLVVVGEGASLSVFERFQGLDGSSGNVLAASGVSLGRGARANFAVSQELPRAMKLVQCAHLDVGREAEGELVFVNQGASWVRQEAAAWLGDDGGTARLLGLNVIQEDGLVDQHTRQLHSRQHGKSDLLFKNAIFDQGRATFGGLIQVEQGAHYTDAYQSCRNLLLSDEAEANAMPGLEINADQVRCSHGATTGRIDPEELFYLKARGIPEDPARRLITLGFAMEVVDRVGDPQVRETLRTLVEETFRQRAFARR